MPDLQSRVTVVGPAARVDAAVPAGVPIAEYIDSIAQLCAGPGDDTLPAAWTLGRADRGAFAPTTTLAAAGVLDGQVLYLRDLTAGEYDEPLSLELDELVADAADRSGGPRWTAQTRCATVLVAGVLWLAAASVAWLLEAGRPGGQAAPYALVAGLLPSLLAWVAGRGRVRIPASARAAMALSAIPCLGVTGWFVGFARDGGHTAGHPAYVGLAFGAVLGALAAMSAAPGIVTFAVLMLAVVVTSVTGVAASMNVTGVENAAIAVLLAFALLMGAPAIAGHLSSTWNRLSGTGDTELTVVAARRLLMGLNAAATAALAVSLVILGTSHDRYALGLAVAVSGAVLLRSARCRFLLDAAPSIAAGLSGLFTVVLRAPDALGAPHWLPAALGLGFGLAVLIVGLVLAFRRTPVAGPRAAWSRVMFTVCTLAAVPLAVGVFGLFDYLVRLGRRM